MLKKSHIMDQSMIKSISFCSNQASFAILKALQKSDLKYVNILKIINMNKLSLGAYYMRKLKELGVIYRNINDLYQISEKGKRIVVIIEQLVGEKFISQDACINGDDAEHDYIIFCRNCGKVKSHRVEEIIQ